MKRAFLLLILIILLIPPTKMELSFADTDYIIINSSYSYVYKDTNYSEKYNFKLQQGSIWPLISIEEDFYKIEYKEQTNTIIGYIPIETASKYIDDQEKILVYNAKIIKNTYVFSITTNQKIDDILLEKNTPVYIYDGFNSKEEYTNIKFIYNNQVITGKVLTQDISPNGVNKGVIIGLSIITAIVGIILILLGFKKKKWHKNLKIKNS